MDGRDRIVGVEEVPTDTTLLFTVADGDGAEREAILLRLDAGGSPDDQDPSGGEVVGWLNYCQHMTHIKLDKGSGAPLRDGEIVCRNHGAMFESDTGLCTFGPCEGAYLNEIEVVVEDGAVYLADPDYEFVRRGPVEDDDPADLSSTSNLEF
jgi:nitrite reductase/ring-hydroxylating ferredoxin subunit